MKNISNEKSSNLRRERNADLLRRMNTGESMSSFNSFSSWYPPRPIIEKNGDAIAKLYGNNVSKLVPSTGNSVDEDLMSPHQIRPLRLA